MAEQDPARFQAAEQELAGAALGEAPPARRVVGTIGLPQALHAEVHAGDTIFVMARDASSQSMVAVTRLIAEEKVPWPLPFVLEDDRLSAGMSLRLSVRIDKDGNATTKQPGDLVGELAQPVTVPASAVRIDVQRVL